MASDETKEAPTFYDKLMRLKSNVYNFDGISKHSDIIYREMRDELAGFSGVECVEILDKKITLEIFGDIELTDMHITFVFDGIEFHFGLLWLSSLIEPIIYSQVCIPSKFYYINRDHSITRFYIGPTEYFSPNLQQLIETVQSGTLNLEKKHAKYVLDELINIVRVSSMPNYRIYGTSRISISSYYYELNDNKLSEHTTTNVYPQKYLTIKKINTEYQCKRCSPENESHIEIPKTVSKSEAETMEHFRGLLCDVTGELLVNEEMEIVKPFHILIDYSSELNTGYKKIVLSEILLSNEEIEFTTKFIRFYPMEDYNFDKFCEPMFLTAYQPEKTREHSIFTNMTRILNIFEWMFIENPTPKFACLTDLMRIQFSLAYSADETFRDIVNNHINIFKYDLIKNDREMCFKPLGIELILTLYPVIRRLSDDMEIEKVALSMIVEMFARYIGGHASERFTNKKTDYTKIFRKVFSELFGKKIIHRLLHIPSVLCLVNQQVNDYTTLIKDADDICKLIEKIDSSNKKKSKSKKVEKEHDEKETDDTKMLKIMEQEFIRTLAIRFDTETSYIWNMLLETSDDMTEWERTSSISYRPLIKMAIKRRNRYKYSYTMDMIKEPKCHNHEIITTILLTVPHTGETKRYPVLRCPDCGTYGTRTRFKIPNGINRIQTMNQYIKKKNVVLVHRMGPAIIVDFLAPPRNSYGRIVKSTDGSAKCVSFKSCVSRNTLRQIEIKAHKLISSTESDKKRLSRLRGAKYNKQQIEALVKKIAEKTEKLKMLKSKFSDIDIFENQQFTILRVMMLKDATLHDILPNKLDCHHHHHCRTRPQHHKEIRWSRTDGVKNFEMLSLIPHTRLALAIQALYRMRVERRRYLTFRHLRSDKFVKQIREKVFTPAKITALAKMAEGC